MSKKVLNYAGRRPMLLALIMATLTLGLLFSGWLTPTPTRAQTGQSNPQSNVETTNCVASSTSTNCTEATVTLSNVPTVTVCVGSGISASTMALITNGLQIIDTSYTNAGNSGNGNCPDTYSTNTPAPGIGTNWWTASGCGINTNGPGLSASGLVATNCGQVTVTFNQKWTHTCDTNAEVASIAGTINVDAVTSLSPSAGQWVDDGDNDSNTDTYLVQYGCNNQIIVTASDCLGLAASDLPSCWVVNMKGNVTLIDYKTFSVDGNTIGKSIINVTCGTSTKAITIIVYKATFKAESSSHESDALWGHAWWVLAVTPSLDDFLTQSEKTSEGSAGWYDSGDAQHHGMIEWGPQYIGGSKNTYTETGEYWWCISFNHFIHALLYVNNLANGTAIFQSCYNNCTSQTEQVASAAFVSISPSTILCDSCDCPLELSIYLNGLSWPPPCSCQQ